MQNREIHFLLLPDLKYILLLKINSRKEKEKKKKASITILKLTAILKGKLQYSACLQKG